MSRSAWCAVNRVRNRSALLKDKGPDIHGAGDADIADPLEAPFLPPLRQDTAGCAAWWLVLAGIRGLQEVRTTLDGTLRNFKKTTDPKPLRKVHDAI